MKPLNSGHLRFLKNLSVIGRCPLLGGNLKKIVTFGTQHFVLYSWPVRYFGCLLLGGFTVQAFSFTQCSFCLFSLLFFVRSNFSWGQLFLLFFLGGRRRLGLIFQGRWGYFSRGNFFWAASFWGRGGFEGAFFPDNREKSSSENCPQKNDPQKIAPKMCPQKSDSRKICPTLNLPPPGSTLTHTNTHTHTHTHTHTCFSGHQL